MTLAAATGLYCRDAGYRASRFPTRGSPLAPRVAIGAIAPDADS